MTSGAGNSNSADLNDDQDPSDPNLDKDFRAHDRTVQRPRRHPMHGRHLERQWRHLATRLHHDLQPCALTQRTDPPFWGRDVRRASRSGELPRSSLRLAVCPGVIGFGCTEEL